MAKKKTEKTESAGGAKPQSKRATASKSRKAPAKPAGAPAGVPMVDTALAAANAAKMLLTKAKLHAASNPSPEQPQKESGSFKQLKESLNRPATHAVSAALGNAFGEHKSNLPTTHSAQQQVAHNQVVGGGANRVNVPRRTAG